MKKIKFLMITISLILVLVIGFETPVSAIAPIIKASEVLSSSEMEDEETIETSDLIISELKSERTENTKTFRLENGNNMVVEYAIPVHFKNENGVWTDYDNSLQKESKEIVFKKADNSEESSIDDINTVEENQKTTFKTETNESENNATVSESNTESKEKETITVSETTHPSEEQYEESKESIEVLSNKVSKEDISFSTVTSETSMVLFDDKKNSIRWGYQGINEKEAKIVEQKNEYEGNEKYTVLSNLFSTVKYDSAFKNVDIENISSPTGIKENIILKKKSAQNSFVIEYEVGTLEAKQENRQVIALLDTTGKAQYYINATYMYDKEGKTSHNISLKIIENKGGKLIVELIADETWLQADDTVFPVTIDPSFITGQAFGATQGSYIDSGNPNTCYGYSPTNPNYEGTIYSGQYYGKHRGFIKMNSLPTLNNGDMIVDATLNLYLANNHVSYYGGFVNDEYTGVYEVTENWDQGTITWNNRPTWDSNVIDYVKFTSSSDSDWYSWNITKLFKKWYENPSSNYGLMLKSMYEESTQECSAFFSPTYPNYYQAHPAFILTYRNNKGIEDYWDYTTFDVGNAGTLHINNYSGTYSFITDIASTADPVMPAGLSYVYNSYMAGVKYNKTSPYTGFGWKMSVQQTLLPSTEYGLTGDAAEKYPYVYTDADGTEHYFYKKGSGSSVKYLDEDGLNLELTVQTASGVPKYTITDKDKNKLNFSSSGLLINTQDVYANTARPIYSGTTITHIQDRGGKFIQLNHNTATYITSVKDADNKITTFTYETVNNQVRLTKITRNDGTVAQFTYTSNGYLKQIEDSDGYKIVITFDGTSACRVAAVQEYGAIGTAAQKLTFDYSGYNETVVQSKGPDNIYGNNNDVRTTYQFDNYGRAVSVQSRTQGGSDFGAENYEHTAGEVNSDGSNVKKINRISGTHALGANTVNYMRNSNVESATNWASASVWGTSTFTWSCTDAHKIFGQKSYLINVTDHSGTSGGRVYQDHTDLLPNTTYTLSGYIKITSLVNRGSSYGAFIQAAVTDGSNNTTGHYSEYITEKADTSIDDGWRRVSVSFKTPSTISNVRINLVLFGTNGKAYFDALQLEKANTASPYNMVLNGSFEAGTYQPTNWNYSENLSFGVNGDTVSGEKYREGAKSFRILGEPENVKTLCQEIPVSGNENDIYIIGAWGKADAVPTNTIKKFKISINVYFSDGTYKAKNSANFNSCVSSWQFVSKAFDLSDGTNTNKIPIKVRIYLNYSNQGNAAYFDNISLVKEPAQSYTYDDDGNLITVTENAKQKSSLEYNSDNKLTRAVDPKGYDYEYEYLPNGKLKSATTQLNAKYTYTYDTKGTVNSVEGVSTDGKKIRSVQATDYPDAADQEYVTSVHDTRNIASAVTTYNAKNGTVKSVQDQAGTTNYTYNAQNDLLSSVSRSGHTITYTYGNHYKNLTGVSSATANYTFTYNQFGLRTSSKVGNRTLAAYTYNPDGSVAQMNYGNGGGVAYTYDKYGNVSAKTRVGSDQPYYYGVADSTGTITKEIDISNHLLYNYVYDSTDRLTGSSVLNNATNARVATFDYDYDLNNNLSKFTAVTLTGTNKTEYTYRQDNLYQDVILDNNKTLHYKYDYLGRPTEHIINTVNNIHNYYTYHDATAYGEDYTTNLVKTEGNAQGYYNYTYDSSNNLKMVSRKLPGETTYTLLEEYSYYDLGQLKVVNYLQSNKRHFYTYDNGGNLLTEKIYDITDYDNPVLENTITYTYGDNTWGDLLTNYNGSTIEYDNIGNPTTYRNGITLTWQNGRQLQKYQKGSDVITYTYGAGGMRLSKTVNGTTYTYLYNGDQLVQETIGDKILDFSYDASGTVYAVRVKENANDEGTYYYYAHNTRGDVTALYTAGGNLYVNYNYDVWGNTVSVINSQGVQVSETSSNISIIQPFRYRGYCFDRETGFYYLQSRYYDPVTHRFLNADDEDVVTSSQNALSDKNLFAYCDNNPICRADDEGDCWHILIGAAVGGVISGAISAISQYATTGSINWGVVGISAASGALSGALAATGIGIVGSIALNGILGGATYAAEQAVKKEKITVSGTIINASAGAISGAIGGPGADGKALRTTLNSTKTGIIRETRRANVKYAAKQTARYIARRSAVKSTIRTSVARYTVGTIAGRYASKKISSKYYSFRMRRCM